MTVILLAKITFIGLIMFILSIGICYFGQATIAETVGKYIGIVSGVTIIVCLLLMFGISLWR